MRKRLLLLLVAAGLAGLVSAALAGSAKSPPKSAKAWLGVWKSKKWGYVVFDAPLDYHPLTKGSDPTRFGTWSTHMTWVYRGVHLMSGGIYPAAGRHANEGVSGRWLMPRDDGNNPAGSFLIFRSQDRFSGGYWKMCWYGGVCRSHHPWRGDKISSCKNGGCKSRRLRFSFRERGVFEDATPAWALVAAKGGGTAKVFANPEVRKPGGVSFLGIEGKVHASGNHRWLLDFGGGSFRKGRYDYKAQRGVAYMKHRNGVQELLVPVRVRRMSGNGADPECKKKGLGVLELKDGGPGGKDGLTVYFFCETIDIAKRFNDPPPGKGSYLKVKISRAG